MNLYCVFFAFYFVNVLSETIENYKKQIVITNEIMDEALGYSEAGFTFAIERIIRKNVYSMEELAYMFAVPNHANTEGENIHKCMKYEHDMQFEIIRGIDCFNRNVPHFRPNIRELGPQFRKANLKNDSFFRRGMTALALRIIITQVQDRYRLNNVEEMLSPTEICHLIGSFKNAFLTLNETEDFIKFAKLDPIDNCILTSAQGNKTYYKWVLLRLAQYWPGGELTVSLI